ncbi:MAG: glycosyltransferase family 2 protein [Parcubacteria group bacterium]
MKNNQQKKVLITIITVCLNSEKYIEETIKSVINQDYKNIEYIIVDGGSTDKTLDIIKKYEKYINKWISEPDKGIYDAMNKGIDMANGELIAFLNSDDYYFSNALKEISKKYKETKADVITGKLALINKKGHILKIINKDSSKMKSNNFSISHPSSFIKTKLMKKYKFDTNYTIAADYKFLFILFLKKYKFININYVIAAFREGGISSFWLKRKKEKIRINKEQYKFIKQYANMHANELKEIATFYILNKDYVLARKYFIQSIKINPFSRVYINLFLSYNPWLYKKILTIKKGVIKK